MTKTLEFHLHPNQGSVFQSEARYRTLVAGRRFGKTTLAITELLACAIARPDALYYYIAPTYRQAKQIAWLLTKRLLKDYSAVKYNEAELAVILPNNTRVELKGADNEDSLRGTGLDGLVVDEFASIYDNWNVWHEVLRPALADKQGWVLFIGTPKGKDAFWELYMRGVNNEPGWQSWQFKTVDNPYIRPEEVAEAQRNTPERYFRQEYEASFEDFVGLIYPEFTKQHHIIEPTHIPTTFPRVGAIDPALSGRTAVLKCAIDDAGRIVVYDEYYELDKRASEVCEAIRDEVTDWYIDPASGSRSIQREGKMYSLFNEYSENGVYAKLGENDVMGGINRVGEHLKNNEILIHSTCKHLIWELERYHWAESKESAMGVMEPRPYKKDDHLVDALRYLVMSRQEKASIELEIQAHPNSAWAKAQALKKGREKQFHYHARR